MAHTQKNLDNTLIVNCLSVNVMERGLCKRFFCWQHFVNGRELGFLGVFLRGGGGV